MCRIAGIISKTTVPEHLERQVSGMCLMMKHGGPDDAGVFTDPETNFCFGHRRLSILDLSAAGHQPMLANEGRLIITYNGEIYNFKEIRSNLQALGYSFTTETDTEVILKAYQQWGTSAFNLFSGMFAFALFDRQLNKTFLVRDASGIKPLYYSIVKNDLIFASEVKAFPVTDYRFTKNEDWKIYLLSFGHVPEPFTTLKNVGSLPKGHYLTWDHDQGSGRVTVYNTFNYTSEITGFNHAVRLVSKGVTQAVQNQLISDAPIGVFLSGGIDSSILTLLADKFQQEKLHTISVNLREDGYSEKNYQRLVQEKIKGKHAEYLFTAPDFYNNFNSILKSMDQPSTDGINSWFVSKCAKDAGLKAVLSGLGADELFGGYPSFGRMNLIAAAKKAPATLLRLAEKHPDPQYKRLYYLSYNNTVGEYLFLRGYFTPATISNILDVDTRQIDEVLCSCNAGKAVSGLTGGNRASWLEMNLYMQNQLLKDTDCMSMSHGLEVRVPFLDQRLIKTVLGISADVKFNPKQSKTLLISAFKDIMPEPVWNRKKMGFSFPFQEWMRDMPQISEPSQYTGKTSKKLISQFKTGHLHWSAAFALYHVNNAR